MAEKLFELHLNTEQLFVVETALDIMRHIGMGNFQIVRALFSLNKPQLSNEQSDLLKGLLEACQQLAGVEDGGRPITDPGVEERFKVAADIASAVRVTMSQEGLKHYSGGVEKNSKQPSAKMYVWPASGNKPYLSNKPSTKDIETEDYKKLKNKWMVPVPISPTFDANDLAVAAYLTTAATTPAEGSVADDIAYMQKKLVTSMGIPEQLLNPTDDLTKKKWGIWYGGGESGNAGWCKNAIGTLLLFSTAAEALKTLQSYFGSLSTHFVGEYPGNPSLPPGELTVIPTTRPILDKPVVWGIWRKYPNGSGGWWRVYSHTTGTHEIRLYASKAVAIKEAEGLNKEAEPKSCTYQVLTYGSVGLHGKGVVWSMWEYAGNGWATWGGKMKIFPTKGEASSFMCEQGFGKGFEIRPCARD